MEPVTVITTALGLAKSAGDITSKLNELYKNVKDREIKQQVAELLDQMQELKRSAYAIEDENRDLRDKLRFKSSDFEFHTPFWFDKAKPEQPLCPKCFAQHVAAPMGLKGQDCLSNYRRCLVCGNAVEVETRPPQGGGPGPSRRGPNSWMG
jgi:hypothetical protein